MAIAVTQTIGYTESSAGTTHTKSSISTTAGRGLVLVIGAVGGPGAVASVTDSAGNTWVRLGASQTANSTTITLEYWACSTASPAAITSITVTTGSSTGVAFRLFELTGYQAPVAASVPLVVATGSSTSPSSGTSGASINAGDLVIGAIAVSAAKTFSSVTFTVGTGTDNKDSTTSTVVDLQTSYRVMTVVTAQTYSATLNTSGVWIAGIARIAPSGKTMQDARLTSTIAGPTRDETLCQIATRNPQGTDGSGQFIPPSDPSLIAIDA